MSQPDHFSLDSYLLIVLNWSVLLESLAGQSKSCSWQTLLCRAASPAVRTHHCGPSTQLECTCQCQGKKVLTYVRMVLETPPIWLYSDFFDFIVTTDENLTLWHWNIKMVQWNHNYETRVWIELNCDPHMLLSSDDTFSLTAWQKEILSKKLKGQFMIIW